MKQIIKSLIQQIRYMKYEIYKSLGKDSGQKPGINETMVV
jgi:hypothetical protein